MGTEPESANLSEALFQLKVPTLPVQANTSSRQSRCRGRRRRQTRTRRQRRTSSRPYVFHVELTDLKALQKGNTEGARIYAQNAIRKKTEGLNLLRLSSRIDAVASRVETAVTMRTVTNSMGSVVRGMDKAMESMNLERVSYRDGARGLSPHRQSQFKTEV